MLLKSEATTAIGTVVVTFFLGEHRNKKHMHSVTFVVKSLQGFQQFPCQFSSFSATKDPMTDGTQHGWTDCHCHLDEFDDPEAVLARALKANVRRVCAVAQYESSWPRITALAAAHPGVVVRGLGLHPAPTGSELSFEEAATRLPALHAALLAAQPQVVGEIGLDWKFAVSPEQRAAQQRLFEAQLAVAEALRVPVSVHSRRAARAVLDTCARWHRATGLGACLHWFTHSAALMRQAAAAGLFVSVGPAGALHEPDEQAVVRKAGRECLAHLLLETDGPVPFAGRPAEPADVADVGTAVAGLIAISPAELMTATNTNFDTYLSGGSGEQ